jgi:hypothetical protein
VGTFVETGESMSQAYIGRYLSDEHFYATIGNRKNAHQTNTDIFILRDDGYRGMLMCTHECFHADSEGTKK